MKGLQKAEVTNEDNQQQQLHQQLLHLNKLTGVLRIIFNALLNEIFCSTRYALITKLDNVHKVKP